VLANPITSWIVGHREVGLDQDGKSASGISDPKAIGFNSRVRKRIDEQARRRDSGLAINLLE
jgi:hypothetical protein